MFRLVRDIILSRGREAIGICGMDCRKSAYVENTKQITLYGAKEA